MTDKHVYGYRWLDTISAGLMSAGVIVTIINYVWYTSDVRYVYFFPDLTVFYFSSIFRIHIRWQEVTLSYVRMAHRDNETFYHSFSIYYVTLY